MYVERFLQSNIQQAYDRHDTEAVINVSCGWLWKVFEPDCIASFAQLNELLCRHYHASRNFFKAGKVYHSLACNR